MLWFGVHCPRRPGSLLPLIQLWILVEIIPSSPFNLMMILSTLEIQPGGKGKDSECVNVCVRTIFEYYLVVVVNDNITERLFQMSKVSNHSERTQGVLWLIFLFNKLKRQTSFVVCICKHCFTADQTLVCPNMSKSQQLERDLLTFMHICSFCLFGSNGKSQTIIKYFWVNFCIYWKDKVLLSC